MSKPQLQLTLDTDNVAEKELYEELKTYPPATRRKVLLQRLCVSDEARTKEKKSFSGFSLVRIITAVAGVLLLFVSIHFTYSFNSQAMSPLWALSLSTAIVLFTSFAFTLASYSSKRTAFMFYLLWFIGVSYSIFTALAGQYQEFRHLLTTDTSQYLDESLSLKEETISLYEQQLEKLTQSEEGYVSILSELDTPEKKYEYSRTWRDTTTQLNQTRQEIKDLTNKITELRDSLTDIHAEKQENKNHRTIYGWIGDILGIPEGFLHFLVILFPSVFIDLVSGLVFKFVLGKRKSDKEQSMET